MSLFNEYTGKPKAHIIEELSPFAIISKDALVKMKVYIDECDDEVGWLGTAYREGKGVYIEDVFLFKQEVHSTTTEITPEGLSDFATEILIKDNGMDTWNNLKVWGHSHVNMGVSPSGQDDEQMLVFKDSGHDWFLRIISNKKGAMKIDLFDYEKGVEYNDIPWYEHLSEDEKAIMDRIEQLTRSLQHINEALVEEIETDVIAEIKAKVTKKKATYTYTYPKGYTGYGYWNSKEYKENKENEYDYLDATGVDTYLSYKQQHEANVLDGIEEYWFLEQLYDCKTTDEVREIITEWGYYDCYTNADIRELMEKVDEAVEGDDVDVYGVAIGYKIEEVE